MKIDVVEPCNCVEVQIDAFYQLARKSGTVNPIGLEERIREAEILAFAFDDSILIGIGAIKEQLRGYINGVFAKAGVESEARLFAHEFGWCFVKESHRGKKLSNLIADALLSSSQSKHLYATTSVSNGSMQHVLEKRGFQHIGKSFLGRKEDLKLFVKS